MAVPKKKTSKSKKNMRRSHHRVPTPNVVSCECGEPRLPHRICPSCGTYRQRQVVGTGDGEE
ncbi:MAG: 50S ribosomal protein L32 [Desulfovermiculus sp.]